MVSTYVEEERLPDDIGRMIEAAEKLEGNIAATDRLLAARQDQLYSGDDEVYKAVIGACETGHIRGVSPLGRVERGDRQD